ncbi:MAG: hypothetical protein ACRCZR_01970 [Cetobacterium sp.]
MACVFVSFDLKNNEKYDEFTKEVEKIGLFKQIISSKSSTSKFIPLPSNVLYGDFAGNNEVDIRNEVRFRLKDVCSRFNFKGNFVIMITKTWGTTTV